MKSRLCRVITSFMVLMCGCHVYVAGHKLKQNTEKQVTQCDDKLQSLVKQLETGREGLFESHVVRDRSGNIVEVCLTSDMVSDGNLNGLSALPKVSKLALYCCANNAEPLTEHSFNLLKKFKQLRCLVLYGAVDELSLSICNAIASVDSLEELTIEYSKIAADGGSVLKKMRLKNLRISESCTILE